MDNNERGKGGESRLFCIMWKLWKDESGVTAIEYTVICVVIGLVSMAAINLLGLNMIANVLLFISTTLQNALP